MISTLKKPNAWMPIAMSLTALTILLGHIALFGIVREADEGTAAHLFQLLIGGQVPIVAFFAVKWLPRAPKQALGVLAIQIIAALAACSPVFYFNL
jgi:hypothetical protein